MKALVTGANGFIGSLLMDVLDEAGVEGVPLLRATSDTRWIEAYGRRFCHGDLSDPGSLHSSLKGVQWVFHVAGLTKAVHSGDFFEVNERGTSNLLKACAQCGSVERFVLVSSLAAVGPSPDGIPVREDAPPRPITSYGRSKLAGEIRARSFMERMPISIVRPPAVYGPRDRGVLVFFRLARMGIIPHAGSSRKSYSLIHGRDLAEGLLEVARSPRCVGETLFLSNPEPCSWTRLVEGFRRAVGTRARSIAIPGPAVLALGGVLQWLAKVTGQSAVLSLDKARDLLASSWTCDPGLAQRLLGYVTRIPLEEGLEETAKWYLAQGWLREPKG